MPVALGERDRTIWEVIGYLQNNCIDILQFDCGHDGGISQMRKVAVLAEAYNVLTEEALKPNGGKSSWGKEGYYFVQSAEHRWKDIVSELAKIAHQKGAIKSADVEKLSVEDASAAHPWAPLLWGGNCRSRGDRIRALGWKPSARKIEDYLPEMVDFEIKSLGTQSSATTF